MRTSWLDHAGIFLAALIVRFAHATFIAETPFFEGLVIDARTYDGLARSIAAGNGFGGSFYQPPLYPALVGGLYYVGIDSAWGITIVQCLAGAAVAALAVELGRRLAQSWGRDSARYVRWAGLLTGALAALWGPLVLFDVERLPPAFVHLAFVTAATIALSPRRSALDDTVIGLMLGVATTGWGLAAVALPGFVFLRARRGLGPRRYAIIATMLLTFSLPVATVWAHNAASGAPGVVVSWNGGINLWLGNNPRWRDTWRARPGAAFEPELERPDREGVTEPGARSAYFVNRVLRDAADRPGAAVGRTIEKFYYVWHGREIRRNHDLAILRESSPIVGALFWELGVFFPFGILVPLALLSAYRRRREPVARTLSLTALLYSVALAAFFVASRYRLPLVLLLLPFAADQIVFWVWKRRPTARELVAAAALLLVMNLPNDFTASFAADGADRGRLRAEALLSLGDLERGLSVARETLHEHPDNANLLVMVADLESRRNGCRAAVPLLERAVDRAPQASTPWVLLGHCHRQVGRLDEAERAYARALALHPFHSEALKGAALVYVDGGDRIGAIALLRRFVEAGYRDPGVEFDLGNLLVAEGRGDEAVPMLENLLEEQPDDRELRSLVERARSGAGR